MLPVLNTEQVRLVDRLTMEREPIASIDLMERAAQAFSRALVRRMGDRPRPVSVLCGPGNNGGDGLAIARLLASRCWPVRVLCPYDPVGSSADNKLNINRLKDVGVDLISEASMALPRLRAGELVVDALFGTGLSRPLQGHYLEVVHWLNSSGAEVVAVDLPSGAIAEGGPADLEAVVHARATLTFQVPKPFLLLPEHLDLAGDVEVLDIGLDQAAITERGSKWALIEAADVLRLLPVRPRVGHKGTFGHALLLAGGRGHGGAAVMAAAAAVRSGTGLVTVAGPQGLAMPLHAAVPEAMVIEDADPDRLSRIPPAGRWSAVGIGPGIGKDMATARVLQELLTSSARPLVLDADALNILADRPELLEAVPQGTLLTPHPGEADRLFGPSADTRARIAKVSAYAQAAQAVVVLKGARTAICCPDGMVLFNPTGNVGMAKGGSGDVLTGLLTGLMAQGLMARDAAVLGVWVHGSAGDIASEETGQDGMTAMDVVRALPKAFRRLRALT